LGRISAIRDALILMGVAELDDEKTTGKQRKIMSWTRRSFDTRLSFSFFVRLALSFIESVRSCIDSAELIGTKMSLSTVVQSLFEKDREGEQSSDSLSNR
jgi:hypothetical protein